MRATSTAVSLTTHVIVVLAAVWAPSAVIRQAPRPPIIVPLPALPDDPTTPPGSDHILVPMIDGDVVVPPLEVPPLLGIDARVPRFVIDLFPGPGPLFAKEASGGDAVDASLVDQPPVLLAGPVPVYPDLLRQAGLQGRVVLEAVIDTLGHVERGSVVIVESAHPAFVVPAQHSLLKSLFRPARVRGVAVRVRVRVPIDFVLRGGRL